MSTAHQEQRASSLADDVNGSSNKGSTSTSSVSMHVDPAIHKPSAISVPLTQKLPKTSVKSQTLTATASKVSRKECANSVKDDMGKKMQEPDDPELIITRGLKEILAKDRAMRKSNELQVSKKLKAPGSDSNGKGKGPNFVICYLCGRQFGSSSISIHRPQCYLKMLIAWERGDPATRGPRPLDPESYEANVKAKIAASKTAANKLHQQQEQEKQLKQSRIIISKDSKSAGSNVTSVDENTDNKENHTEMETNQCNEKPLEESSAKEEGNEYDATELYNELALEAFKKQLAPCPHCHRTFLPDRLVVHLRGCKPKVSNNNENDNHDVKSKKKQINKSLTEVHINADDNNDDNNKHENALTQSDADKNNQKSEHKTTSLHEMIKLKRKELQKKKSSDLNTEEMCKAENHEEIQEGVSDIENKNSGRKMSSEVHKLEHQEQTKEEHAELHDVMSSTLHVIEPEARTESPRPHPPDEEHVSNRNSLCTTITTTRTNKEQENSLNLDASEQKSNKTRQEEEEVKCKETSTSPENESISKAFSTSRENSLLLETLPYKSTTDNTASMETVEKEEKEQEKKRKGESTAQLTQSDEVNMKSDTNKCADNDNCYNEDDNDNDDDENYDYQVKKIKLNNVSHFKNVPSRLKAELEAHRIRFSEPVVCSHCHKKFHTQRIKQHEEECALRNSPQLHAEVKRAKSSRSMSGGNGNQSRQLFTATTNNNNSTMNSSFDSNTNRSNSLSNSSPSSFTTRTSQSVGVMPLAMTGPTIKFTELEQSDNVVRRALSVNDDRLYTAPHEHDNKGSNKRAARINKKLETKPKNNSRQTKSKTTSSSSQLTHTANSSIQGEVAINAKLKTHEIISQEKKNNEGMITEVAIKFCPECGVKVQHDKQKFCMSCGTKISM